MSVAPSLEEKISFLIQNYPEDERNESAPGIILILEDKQSLENKPMVLTSSNRTNEISAQKPLRQPMTVKREEPHSHSEGMMDKMRKKVCRKIFAVLKEDFKMASNEAKELTLVIEEKVNQIYPSYEGNNKNYLLVIKTIFQKLKVPFCPNHSRTRSH